MLSTNATIGTGGSGSGGLVPTEEIPNFFFSGEYTIHWSTHPITGTNRWYAKLLTSGILTATENTVVDVFCVGGGGGGGFCQTNNGWPGAGGGGSTTTKNKVPFVKNIDNAVTIGNGADPAPAGSNSSGTGMGGRTTIGPVYGSGGSTGSYYRGGSGGSGGAGGISTPPTGRHGSRGGSNGTNGAAGGSGDGGVGYDGGSGQNRTTRPFDADVEPFKSDPDLLFSGGGSTASNANGINIQGGSGGGGYGGAISGGLGRVGGNAVPNTGGGGGSGPYQVLGGKGGSGILILRGGDWSAEGIGDFTYHPGVQYTGTHYIFYELTADGKFRWYMKILSSGTLYSGMTQNIDAFLLGGGGGGGSVNHDNGGAAGGSGHAKTVRNINFTDGLVMKVSIGAGASGGASGRKFSSTLAGSTPSNTLKDNPGGVGSPTTITIDGLGFSESALGGEGGSPRAGGNGGSGGAGAATRDMPSCNGGKGGANGQGSSGTPGSGIGWAAGKGDGEGSMLAFEGDVPFFRVMTGFGGGGSSGNGVSVEGGGKGGGMVENHTTGNYAHGGSAGANTGSGGGGNGRQQTNIYTYQSGSAGTYTETNVYQGGGGAGGSGFALIRGGDWS